MEPKTSLAPPPLGKELAQVFLLQLIYYGANSVKVSQLSGYSVVYSWSMLASYADLGSIYADWRQG